MSSWPGGASPLPASPTPPPGRNTGLIWASIAAGIGALVFIAGFIVFIIAGPDYEEYPDDEYYYYVDDSSVIEAVQPACDDMIAAGKEIGVFSTPADGAKGLKRFVAAARPIVTAVDNTGTSDENSLDWRDDWQVLLDAVDRYAAELADDPGAEYEEPTTADGYSIIYEMSNSSDADCEVPAIIAALDSTPPAAY